jgi:hypothetical protein
MVKAEAMMKAEAKNNNPMKAIKMKKPSQTWRFFVKIETNI